jgi:hypothetical protein
VDKGTAGMKRGRRGFSETARMFPCPKYLRV